MNFITEAERENLEKSEGLKLFYTNSSQSKEYESHITVLKEIAEDYEEIKIYVIKIDSNNSSYGFEFYEDTKLLKGFTNCHIGAITSFLRKYMSSCSYGNGEMENDDENEEEKINKKIENLLKSNKIILFMKGSKTFPQCKFSNAVVFMLNSLKIKYNTYDILQDEDIRSQLKIYSNWPTYPQLYINTELIGGHDIIKSMYDTNELKEIIPSDCFEE
ncbi:glutaredoxin-like protein [Plasmodium vinckei]|uniref:Glutaredoxin-like protein n=1 Tax=Plasmodium vinckei TaxID=5860 RepID=A0A6V7SBB5_PLAVN|nr:glutaredoxin-like protein [Plasmodium vinckei]